MATKLIGETFKADYCEEKVTWEVTDLVVGDVYLCEITEPEEYRGKIDVFLGSRIRLLIGLDAWIAELAEKSKTFYGSLRIGDVAHYHDGFGRFVRCEVVKNGELLPVAFVGDWKDDKDIQPSRALDGTITDGYWLGKALNGESFTAHSSNIWEAVDENSRAYMVRSTPGFDPTKADPIKIKAIKVSERDEQIAAIHRRMGKAIDALGNVYLISDDVDALVDATVDALMALLGPSEE